MTEQDGIGIAVGGMVYVKPVEEWHSQAVDLAACRNETRKWIERFLNAAEWTSDLPPAAAVGLQLDMEEARITLQRNGDGE